jgi:hypothetical protein
MPQRATPSSTSAIAYREAQWGRSNSSGGLVHRRARGKLGARLRCKSTGAVAVWLYVPPLSGITARRAKHDQFEASIEDLTKRGAKITLSTCGPKKRLCVLVDEADGAFGDWKPDL